MQAVTEIKFWHGIFFLFSASTMLVLLYLFKNYLYPPFFVLICCSSSGAVAAIIEDSLSAVFPKSYARLNSASCPSINTGHLLCGKVNICQFLEVLCGAGVVLTWAITRNWVFNDIIAASLALTFFKTIRLNSVGPGVFLLSLLFCYDIFFVFISPALTKGTSIMVAVATTIDLPIMLKMPRTVASP